MAPRLATVPGHACNVLCGDGLHVDRCWSEPAGTARDVAANWAYRYDVEVVEVRRVEPMPPSVRLPDGEAIVIVSGSRRMEQWDGCVTWGVWWREREIDAPEPRDARPPARPFPARYPGVCARTGQLFPAGTPIVRARGGWAIAAGEGS